MMSNKKPQMFLYILDLPLITTITSIASLVFVNKDPKPFNKLNIHKTRLSFLVIILLFRGKK
jgi:hypothetical protein